ncbi:hypothetical protein [Natrinema marinum]|uniref:hypothetical protein n=1 Tax=Natrinema marinum TaxID=2961598 RepID=UPI0020C8DDC5|nr:hypothetical protein [Natrinema marinum]
MTRDFTFEMYENLLQSGLESGYDHLTVREFLSRSRVPERFIIHRHDVDRKPENALAMARLEAEYGVSSTYYVRTIEKTFDPDLIREIEALGHEIGYHYEDMDRSAGDLDRAHESFATNLERVRQYATVDTVCMHGNPLTTYDNREMWRDGDETPTLEMYDLLGEAYLSLDFETVVYFSDTGRTWRDGAMKIKDHTIGPDSKSIQIETTPDLIRRLEACSLPACCVLTHPNRWARTTTEHVVETAKDSVVNLGKLGLNMVR